MGLSGCRTAATVVNATVVNAAVVNRTVVKAAVLLCSALCLLGCPAGEPEQRFATAALPVLEHRCLTPACHGVGPGEPWPNDAGYFVRIDREGLVTDLAAARRATLAHVATSVPARLSSLIQKPLPRWADGGPHVGGAVFSGPDDPGVAALASWIDAEDDGSGGEDLQLAELEQLFGDTVLPTLVERCGRGGCHGPADIANTAFAGRPDPATGVFATRDIRAAYQALRKHLSLWSADPMASRLVRKAIGALEGGIAHRGGDSTFFPEAPLGRPEDAPGIAAMVAWARAERAALGVTEGQGATAVIFVAGPPALRQPYRISPAEVGSDLFITDLPVVAGAERNLTAALHAEGPVEIRDPALSFESTRVAFAMRREGETTFALWELDLATETATRRTPEAAAGSFVQPVYSPFGGLVAAWDGHGEASADGDGVAPELVVIGDDGRIERLTYTPAPEVAPTFLATGKTRGELLFATRRRGERHPEGVLFRFPLDHDASKHGDPEYHVHFGASVAPLAPLVARDLPDGRQVIVVLADTAEKNDRGSLAILERSFGGALPTYDPVGGASTGGFRHPMTMLDPTPRFRDLAPLPDGRVLVTADRDEAIGEDAIYIASLQDSREGVTLSALEPLLAVAGRSLRSPVAVFPRPPEDDAHGITTDGSAETGYLILRDVGVLEAIFGRAGPWGARRIRTEISGLRVLRWRGGAAAAFAHHGDGGTSLGLSDRGPAEVFAEFTLPEDRSAWLEVPARTPLLLQLLDRRGMIVGNQLDRWYYAEGDETVPGGTNARTYAHACSACHGSLTGLPQDAAVDPPDAISSASRTLSTHEYRDPRRPLLPQRLDRDGVGIDYLRDVGPYFAATCAAIDCHGGDAPRAGLPLDDRPATAGPPTSRFPAAYTALLETYVDRRGLRARRSRLVERLLGEELEAPAEVAGRCPPGGIDAESLATVVRWIESGAYYDLAASEESP